MQSALQSEIPRDVKRREKAATPSACKIQTHRDRQTPLSRKREHEFLGQEWGKGLHGEQRDMIYKLRCTASAA